MKKFLIYNTGGLGDSVTFSLILSLKNHFKKTKFLFRGTFKPF